MIFRRHIHSPIGLDVGARTIKAVQLAHARRGWEVCAAAAFQRIAPGEEVNPAEIIRAVGVLRRQGFVGDQAVVCIPSDKMLSAVIELPERTSGAPLDAIARQELARSCKKDPGSIEIAWWELPAPAFGPTGPGARPAHGTQALALGCAHADANALLACFEPSGLDVIAIDARPAAVARACAALAADAPNLTAILSLGHDAAHILILVGRTLVYERTLPEASLRLLASGVANQLSVSESLAEHVLRTIGCRPAEPSANSAPSDQAEIEALGAEARALVCAHADALAAELKTSLSYAARRFDGEVMRILLSGVGADIPGIGDRIAQRAGIPEGEARIARADALTPARPDTDPALLGPGAALALGLALHGASESSTNPHRSRAAAPVAGAKEVAA